MILSQLTPRLTYRHRGGRWSAKTISDSAEPTSGKRGRRLGAGALLATSSCISPARPPANFFVDRLNRSRERVLITMCNRRKTNTRVSEHEGEASNRAPPRTLSPFPVAEQSQRKRKYPPVTAAQKSKPDRRGKKNW